jgi:hypothetical protein
MVEGVSRDGASLFLKRLRGEGLGGGGGAPSLFTGDPGSYVKKGSGYGISPLEPRGTWNLEGGSYTWDFERWRALGTGNLSARDSMKGTLREGSFNGDPERYVMQGSEMGVCFHRGPALGEHGGALLSWGILI